MFVLFHLIFWIEEACLLHRNIITYKKEEQTSFGLIEKALQISSSIFSDTISFSKIFF